MQLNFTGTIDLTKPITIVDQSGVTYTLVLKTDNPPPPPEAGTAEYWRGDAETGDLSQWAKVIRAETDRIQVVTNPVSNGKYSYRFELRGEDSTYGERVQLDSGISGGANAHYIKDGDEGYYGCSFYLPSDSLAKNTNWRQFLQFKGIHTGSPPLQIGFNNDNWRLYYRPTNDVSNIMKWQSPSPARKNVWEKFTFHIKWSADPKVGFFEAYYNNTLVVPKFYTSLIHIQDGKKIDNVVDIGIYRDSAISTTDIIYIDNFVAGRSYDEVKQ